MAFSRFTFFWAHIVRILVAAALICVSTAFPQAQATPVTFRFEATVDQVTGSAPELIEVVPGDTIYGSFTYEPTPFGARSEQTNDLSFNVNGLLLFSGAYEILLGNDTPFPILGSFPTGAPFPGVFDSASIVCSLSSNSTQCTPSQIPSADEWKWRPLINLTGTADTLNDNTLSSDLNWNGFVNRDLRLTIEHQSQSIGVTIQATVGPMILVPEPGAFILAIVATMLGSESIRSR